MFLLRLLFKNAFRHTLRSWLTIVSIAIAILAFGLLQTVIDGFYSGAKRASVNRIMTRNAISMTFTMPASYETRIKQIPGVSEVSAMNWFGGIYIDEKHFFANFAVEPRKFVTLYKEYAYPPVQKEAFFRDRKSAAVGRKLAERFGWKLGDTVVLKGTIYPGNWEFVIRMIYSSIDESGDERLFFFHYDYLNETLKKTVPAMADHVGMYVVGVEHGDEAAQIAGEIDKAFANSLAETLTETEKAFTLSFLSMASSIIIIVRLVSLIVIVIIIAVAANTMAMTTRERTGEYAVLKTLGFGALRIGALIFGESLVISLTGCALGIAGSFPAAQIFRHFLGGFFPAFIVSDQTIVYQACSGALVGVIAAIVPTWHSVHIRIADGLRRIG
jgi:putative ABC transport system permease protein